MAGGKTSGGPGKASDIPTRAFDFGVRVIRLCRFMDREPGTCRTLSAQILRSGTSIGANVEEGQAAQSKADFISKYCIALKEARETLYRLRLLRAGHVISPAKIAGLITEADELVAMLTQAIITARGGPGRR